MIFASVCDHESMCRWLFSLGDSAYGIFDGFETFRILADFADHWTGVAFLDHEVLRAFIIVCRTFFVCPRNREFGGCLAVCEQSGSYSSYTVFSESYLRLGSAELL